MMPSPFTSPPRSTRFINYSPSPSPLTKKRRRLEKTRDPITSPVTQPPFLPPPPALPHSPYRFNSRNEVEDNPEQIPSTTTLPAVLPPPDAMQRSLQAMEERSQIIRQKLTAEEQSDKATGETYARQVANYQVFWDGNQATLVRTNPSLVPIPAFPVIAAKVAIYLEHETTRPQKRKRADGSDSTATIGVQSVKQIVSALENWRVNNQHLYRDNPEAQTGLRLDPRIKRFESAAAHKEPERVKMAHTLKATGTNADTFSADDLKRCADWCLTDFKGPMNIYIGLRDRAMLLTSCSVAFRGDSTRSLLLSDLFTTDVIFNAKGLGEVVPALALIADNAKHNQTGRTDEHGAFRHRHVELCPVGGIALLLFAYFHVRNCSAPKFAPDFSDSQYGDFGKREWYGIHLFPAGQNPMDEMGYDNHRKRVNLIYKKNDINITKVTHAGRVYSVKTAREYGASVDGAKALGGWADSGSFHPCYDRALPVDALLGAAMFDAARPEQHFLARDFLEPPANLLAQIFPWIDDELLALQAREKESSFARDIALRQLFKLLIWFRTIILQDGALLYNKYPNAQLFKYPPFNSPEFRQFAADSVERLADVEAQANLALKNLPQNLVRGFRGAMSGISLAHRAERDETRAYMQRLELQIQSLTLQLSEQTGRGSKGRKSSSQLTPVLIPPPLFSGVLPPVFVPEATALSSGPKPFHEATEFPFLTGPSDFFVPPPVDAPPAAPQPALQLTSLTPSFTSPPSLSSTSGFSTAQTSAWNLLALKYSVDRLRRHHWDWVEKTNTFLPKYTFQPVPKISDIWTEWATGLDGFLSVRELNEGWNAKWKRDIQGVKSEYSRRKKVVDLIEQLARKPNWNLELALRFIREVYETSFRTTRAFCDYLQSTKTGGFNAVLERSRSFVN